MSSEPRKARPAMRREAAAWFRHLQAAAPLGPRDCLRTSRLRGRCSACGADCGALVHVPTAIFPGIYCARCCPCCAGKASPVGAPAREGGRVVWFDDNLGYGDDRDRRAFRRTR